MRIAPLDYKYEQFIYLVMKFILFKKHITKFKENLSDKGTVKNTIHTFLYVVMQCYNIDFIFIFFICNF